MSGPLDFEVEDLLLNTPPAATKRKKVIGLDELLADYYTKQSEIDSNAHKKSKAPKGYNSDDEDDKDDKSDQGNETEFSKIADECEKQMKQIITENEIPLWGQEIFGQQKSLPMLSLIELENCKLLQILRKNELHSDLLLDNGQGFGESFLEGLLINGWLLQFAFISGFVEASVASWTFYQALYSSNEQVQLSACDFWCSILLSKNEAGQPSMVLEWIPSYHELKEALEVYGYLSDTVEKSNSRSSGPGSEGPPVNISSWIKILSSCFQIRKFQSIFSVSEAEEVLVVMIHFFLARQLQGLSFILAECLQSILSFFPEAEWSVSCEKVAHAIAHRVPKDLNSVRVVECISGTSARNKHLRGRIAIHMLGILFDKNVSDGKGIMKSLLSVKLKDKDADFFSLYIYLVLSENWLLSYDSSSREETSALFSMWTKVLRSFSGNISSTDWRIYAAKVRSKASYLLQSIMTER